MLSAPRRPSPFGCPLDLLRRLPLQSLTTERTSRSWKAIKQRLSLTRGRIRNWEHGERSRRWQNRIEWYVRVGKPMRAAAPDDWTPAMLLLLDGWLGTGVYLDHPLAPTPHILREIVLEPDAKLDEIQRMHCQWKVLDAMLRVCYQRMTGGELV